MSPMRNILMSLFTVGILLGTNTRFGSEEIYTKIAAGDTSIYLGIANSAPHLPGPESQFVYHGAQRFIFSYFCGVLARVLNIDSFTLFQNAVIVLHFLTFLFFIQCLEKIGVIWGWRVLLLSAFAFNPYIFRLEIAFSGFVNDSLFLCGLSLLALSLVRVATKLLVFSFLIMIIGKQTTFFCLPAALLFIFLHPCWKSQPRRTISFVTLAIVLSVHGINSYFASLVSSPSVNLKMLTGMLTWILFDYNFKEGFDFIGKTVWISLIPMSILLPLHLKGILRSYLRQFEPAHLWLPLFFTTILQPFLSGPTPSFGNIPRLFSLGLIFLYVWMGQLVQHEKMGISRLTMFTVAGALFMGSFHHLFSLMGPNPARLYFFITLHLLGVTVTAFALLRTLPRHNGQHSYP